MKSGRITITRRHTGRFYIGLDTEHFFALYGFLLFAKGSRQMFQKLRPEELRIVEKFQDFAADIKAKAGMSPIPSVPSVKSAVKTS